MRTTVVTETGVREDGRGSRGSSNPSFSSEQEDAERQRKILELYDLHNSSLYRYLRTLGLAKDEAEDAIQETFLRLIDHLDGRAKNVNIGAWLFQVAHNLSMDKHRMHRKDLERTAMTGEIVSEPSDPAANPEQTYLQKEAMKRVDTALYQLTPKQRNGILLRAQGLRYMEIGAVLGVSESRAIHLVKRGLTRLAGGR